MNHIYKLVWNAMHQTWVAIPEVASGVGNLGSIGTRRKPCAAPARFLRSLIAAGAMAIAIGASFVLLSGQVSAQTIAPTTLPQGGVVTQGAATLQGAGSVIAPVLNVNQTSQRAVINWDSFNLGSASTVNFNQPNAQSATLNRVLDMNPSQILGHINAPGQVTLINPAGVYFSPSAVLDVGALTATTLGQTDADFMAGKASFSRNGSTGSVVNEGTLKAADYIALLAPEVRNQGTITASAVAMAAGESIQLNFDAFSRLASLSVTPSQIKTLVENKTAILAPGGLIILSATALSGLQASVINSGQIDASSLSTKGGRIVLEGDSIQLSSGSSLNASGATGGGTVLVGGDWQGSGTMAQATTVTMAQGATIDASATQSGDGGKVVLWSDVGNANSSTTVNGSITARGGALGGNGGQVETSGHTVDSSGARINAGADQGTGGLWLIDPADATITQTIADSYRDTLNTGTSVLNDVSGNITWNSNVTLAKTAGTAATLTLRTTNNGSITLNSGASITSTSNPLNLVLWTRYNNEGGSGSIFLNGANISTNGGHVSLSGGNLATWNGIDVGGAYANTYALGGHGINLTGTTINTGGGNIQIKGQSYYSGGTAGNSYGVVIAGGSSLTTTTGTGTGTGTIDLVGDLKGTYTNGVGVLIGSSTAAGSVTIASDNGAINITGTGADQSGSGSGFRHAVSLNAGNSDQIAIKSTSGAITLSGAGNFTSSSFTSDSSGLQLQSNTMTSGIQVVSRTGAINLIGSNALEATAQNVNGIRFTAADAPNSIRIGYDGSNAYSGNILIQSNSIEQFNNNAGVGSLSVQSTGTLTVQSAGNAFTYLRAGGSTLTFDNDWNFGTGLSAFTLGKSTNTLDLTLSNALTTAGPISLYGGNLNLNANLTSTLSGAAILAKASGNITSNANRSFQTNNGNLIFWSNASTGGTAGAQTFGDSNTFNTANGSTGQATGGGKIVMAGGLDDGSNGGTAGDGVPDGFALSSATNGISLGTAGAAGPTSMYSGGGNILLRGKSTGSGLLGIQWNKVGTVVAGNGTVSLVGTATQGHGIELGASTGSTSITAGGGDATHAAISIVGTTTSTNSLGIQSGGGSMQATGTGGITVTGTTDAASAAQGTNLGMNALALSGPIAITAIGGTGLRYGGTLGKNGAASSSNVTLTANALTVNTGITVDTTGTLTVQPYSTSFSSALSWGTSVTVAPTVSALTLGKTGNTAAITTTTAQSIAGPINIYGGAVTVNQNLASSASGDITVFADTLAFGASGRLTSAGNLNIAPTTASRTIGLGGGTGALALASSYFTTNFVDGFAAIKVGDANSGKITSSAITTTDNLVLRNASAGIDITGAVNAGSNTVTLQSTGAVAESGAGTVTAGGLLLQNAGSFTLAGANAVTNLAASGTGAISYTNASALTVGAAGGVNGISSTGTVAVNTTSGNLTVAQNIATTNATATAVVLNAGVAAAAGGAGAGASGNIVISGSPTITVGTGGRATLMTGTVAGSTNLTTLAGLASGSGRFRYGSDEGTTAYNTSTQALGTGLYAIYREAPTLNVTANNATITYGDTLPTFTATTTGAQNGDTVTPSISVGGSKSTSLNYTAGAHSLTPSATNDLGYASGTVTNGTLTVNQKTLTVSGISAANRQYNGTVAATVTPSALTGASGLIAGDVVVVGATGIFGNKNAGTGKTVTLTSSYTGADKNNYAITDQATTTANITAAPLTVTAPTVTKTYDGTTSATGTATTTGTVYSGDSVTAGSLAFADKNAGTGNKTVNASGYTVGDGVNNSNYTISYVANTTSTINKATVSVTAPTVSKTYDGTTSASGSATVGTLAGAGAGETVGTAATLAYTNKDAGTANKTVQASGLVIKDSGNVDVTGNYAVTYANNTTSTINKADLAVSGVSAANKTYDATTAATLSGGAVSALGADVVTVTSGSGVFADKNVGTGKTVTATGFTLGGADAGNYNAVQPAALTADITQAGLTLSTGNVVKTYDATTSAIGNLVVTGGALLGSDSLSGGTFAFTNKNAGAGNKVVTTSGVTVADGNGGGNYAVTYANNTTSTINKADLAVSGVSAANKTYDATTAATLSGGAVSALGADVVTVTSGSGVFADKNVGTGKTVTATGFTLGGADAGNYNAVQPAALTADITQAGLTLSTGNVVKTYDATTSAIGNLVVTGGALLGSDSLSGGTFAFTNKNAGAGNKVVTTSGVTVADGNGGGNYAVTYANNTTSTINKADLAVSGVSAANKTYDATTAATLSGGAVSALGADVVTVTSGSGVFADKNVGTGKTVTATGFTLGGADAGNYNAVQPAALTADITQAGLTLSTGNVVKTYDATTSAIGNLVVTGGALLGSDSLSGGTFAFTNKNAGAGNKVVTTSGVTVADGNGGGNYAVTYANNTTSTINKADLAVSGVSAANKTYDATTAATLSGGAVSALGADVVTVTSGSGVFVDKNVGTGKTVTATGFTLGGADAGNYNAVQPAALTADITQAGLTLSTGNVVKTYDATTSAIGNLVVTGGALLGSDSLSGGTFAFTNKNAGAGNKVVTTSGVTVADGNGGGNYAVTYANNTTSTINKADLAVSGVSAANKTYDATTAATLSGGAVSALGADVVTVTSGSGVFADKNVGTGKTVTATGFTLGGADAGNYNAVQPAALTADITQAGLTLSTGNVVKTYDATTSAIGNLVVTGGALLGSDSLSGGTFAFTNKNAGAGNKVVTTSGVTVADGNGGGNYAVTYANNTTSTINKADLAVSGVSAANKTYDATTAATLSGGAVSALGADVVTVTSGSGVFVDKNVGTGKTVTATGFTLGGADAGNYNAVQPAALTADITQAGLTLSTGNVVKTYDATTSAIGNLVVTGGALLGSDSLSGGTFAFTNKNAGAGNKVVTTSGVTVADGNGGGNYAVTYANNTTSTINKADLAVSGVSAANKTYDATTAATLSGGAVSALGADVVTVTSGSGVFADKNVGTGKTVTATGFTLGGADAGNYNAVQPAALTADITQAGLTLSTGNVVKTYDATTSAIGNLVVTGGALLGSDSLSGGTFAFTNKNAGAGNKVVTTSGVTVADGNGGGNYAVTYANNTTSTINKADLAVSGVSAANKTYDATTAATLSGGAVSALGADVVTVTSGSGVFVDKNVGTGKTVTATGFTLGGADAGNYNAVQPAALTADITQAGLTLSTGNVVKTYDATTSAIGNLVVTGGALLGSDSLSGGTFAFTNKNAGAGNKVVTTSGVTVADGNGGGNYAVTYANNTTSTINKADLAVSGVSAANKTYDATTAATLSGGAVSALGADVVTVTSGSGVFADKNVGTGKTVTATGFTLGGADAGNYNAVQPAALTADITQAGLTLSTGNVVKTYDATTSAIGNLVVTGGALLGSDSLSGGTFAFTDPSVGLGNKTVTTGGATVNDGNGGGNYLVTYVNNTTSTINPASVAPPPTQPAIFTPAPVLTREVLVPHDSLPVTTTDAPVNSTLDSASIGAGDIGTGRSPASGCVGESGGQRGEPNCERSGPARRL